MNWKLFEELTQLHGVSGYERQVSSFIAERMEPYGDRQWIDANGNLIVFKKGTSPSAKKLLFCAHMDEIGLQVIKINDDGTLMVKGLGSCWIYTTYQSRVMFRNGVAGVVSSRVRPEKVENQMVNLFVDLGVSTKQEAEQLVEIGDVAVFLGDYLELAGSCVTAKAIDDRVGCYMQMQALMELEAPKNDVYLAFTVQEEVGTRGGGVVAHQVRPDVGVAVDVTPAHDRPGDLEGSNALGKGVAIKISDNYSISDEGLVGTAAGLCRERGIPYQKDCIYVGGTDAAPINLSGDGVKTIGFSVPTRYTHGPHCIASLEDISSTVRLLKAFMDAEF